MSWHSFTACAVSGWFRVICTLQSLVPARYCYPVSTDALTITQTNVQIVPFVLHPKFGLSMKTQSVSLARTSSISRMLIYRSLVCSIRYPRWALVQSWFSGVTHSHCIIFHCAYICKYPWLQIRKESSSIEIATPGFCTNSLSFSRAKYRALWSAYPIPYATVHHDGNEGTCLLEGESWCVVDRTLTNISANGPR